MEKSEKQSKLRNKISKILPKAVAAITVTFQNPPFSPGRDHKFRSHGAGKGFSGPMIPYEARRKQKDETTQEPTSPKISCMGQIKHKKKQQQQVIATKPTRVVNNSSASSTPIEVKKHGSNSKFQNFFHRTRSAARKSDFSSAVAAVSEEDRSAPPMGEMRRFTSGREAFSNFDWKNIVTSGENDQRDCYSDPDEVDEDEILIPFSAPILVGGGNSNRGGANSNMPSNLKPRKEINLWKRRTMAPPRPLQVNPVLTAK